MSTWAWFYKTRDIHEDDFNETYIETEQATETTPTSLKRRLRYETLPKKKTQYRNIFKVDTKCSSLRKSLFLSHCTKTS